jgi:hypothetical protein
MSLSLCHDFWNPQILSPNLGRGGHQKQIDYAIIHLRRNLGYCSLLPRIFRYIVGQILVGINGGCLASHWILIQDATMMFVGVLTLTVSYNVTENGWVICYVWSLFFHGVGLGSEDLMTATSGVENTVGFEVYRELSRVFVRSKSQQ